MKSRWLLNLLILAGIAALVLIARFEPGLEKAPETHPITLLRTDDVHRIHINRPLRDDLVLVRKAPDHWWIERAVPLPADTFKVMTLARLAEQTPVRNYAVGELDLDALQLSPPYATLILNDTAVEFGNLDPIDELRYVRVADEIYLIPDNHLALMEAGYSQFVRARLFDPDDRIESVRLPGMRLARGQHGWQVSYDSPDAAREVSADVLQQFVEIWQSASALSVQAANPELSGEEVEIRLGDSTEPVVFQIISRGPELTLVRPDYGLQYRMGNRSEAMLTLDAAEADIKD
jgi:hypothetical protein